MADERLRIAERAGDSGRHIAERIRAGTLTRKRLELVAYCGDEVARRVLGRPWKRGLPKSVAGIDHGSYSAGKLGTGSEHIPWNLVEEQVQRWARGLARWGQATCVRAVAAAARVALAALRRQPFARYFGETTCAKRAVKATEAWLACPCEEHRSACNQLGPLSDGFQAMASCVVLWGEPGRSEGNGRAALVIAIGDFIRVAGDGLAIRSAISAALVPWALRD